VEVRETAEADRTARPPSAPAPGGFGSEDGARWYPALFLDLARDQLLDIGVPEAWVDEVHNATELNFFDLAEHLPEEASEALLDYAASGVLARPRTVQAGDGSEVPADPLTHPDAQRRFRVVENADALRQALAYPWEKWTVFLHPAQQAVVDRDYGGPARVSGSAGTGKTVVALHRAVGLARAAPEARVLLATFSKPLARALRVKLGRLVDPEDPVARRITIGHLDGVAHGLFEQAFGRPPTIASRAQVEAALRQAAEARGETRFSARFLRNEWRHVVDAWQLRDWPAYRDVSRLGRKTRIGGKQREALWAVFADTQAILRARKVVTWAEAVADVTAHFDARAAPPFDHAVVDEAQDISIPQLRLLRAIVPSRPDDLFFAGDLGQRIFQQPFSWLSQGVDIRGRAASLTVNYRTSHQIRRKADKLLPMRVRDVDGYAESRKGVISVFDGPAPEIGLFETEDDEITYVGDWLDTTCRAGVSADEIGLFVRTEQQLYRARRAARAAGLATRALGERPATAGDGVVVGTMHEAKGQEFKAVAVMACDDEVLPLQARIDTAAEESEIEDVFETERHLLYVAVTRARDRVIVTGLDPGSEFISDLLDA
jgi:superfamily I DNA/RNA helicase